MLTIKDPKIEPFHIVKDRYCYTVYETITPQEKYLEKGSEGKDYVKPLGHYSNFSNALNAIGKAKIMLKETGEYNSIQEYIEEYRTLQSSINNLLESVEI
jgi:hypothetical protein